MIWIYYEITETFLGYDPQTVQQVEDLNKLIEAINEESWKM